MFASSERHGAVLSWGQLSLMALWKIHVQLGWRLKGEGGGGGGLWCDTIKQNDEEHWINIQFAVLSHYFQITKCISKSWTVSMWHWWESAPSQPDILSQCWFNVGPTQCCLEEHIISHDIVCPRQESPIENGLYYDPETDKLYPMLIVRNEMKWIGL